MKVLGSYVVGWKDQVMLVPGASMELPRSRIPPNILAQARIGDLLWVQEPWVLLTSRRYGPQNISVAIPGPMFTPPPARIKPIMHLLRYRRPPAQKLPRSDSRAALEIMGIGDAAVRVEVHMQQVDAFLKERRAQCG